MPGGELELDEVERESQSRTFTPLKRQSSYETAVREEEADEDGWGTLCGKFKKEDFWCYENTNTVSMTTGVNIAFHNVETVIN